MNRILIFLFPILLLFAYCKPTIERNNLDLFVRYQLLLQIITGMTNFSFYYLENTKILTIGESVTLSPTSNKTIQNCSISPALPSGLSLSSDCVISGVPTTITASSTFVVEGSDGSSIAQASITLAVQSNVPASLNYAGSPFTFTTGVLIATQVPTYTGTISSCVSVPALPTGLILDSACTITGTPTINQIATNYNITASNAFGSTMTTITITVVSNPPASLTYSGSPYIFTILNLVPTITPAYTGSVTNCYATPVLPTGLSINPLNCEISGTPTSLQSATNHLITAENAYGNTTTTIVVTVNIAPPASLSYTGSPYIFTENLAITTITPTFTGTVTSCTSSPTLPTGLGINNATCEITGTPTILQGATGYTITATNTSGSTTANIIITVNIAPPASLNYAGSPYIFTQGIAITTITPTFSGTVTSCTSSPTLPTGLGINSTTCAISGTPTTLQGATGYTITATNSSGSTTANIIITVNIAPPASLNYAGSPYILTEGVAITTITPTFSGTVTSCTSSPTLPTGLGINSTTCAISGTPTTLQGATTHTITATNASGSTTFDIGITVNIAPPTSLNYTGSPYIFTQGVAISTITPTFSGTVTSCTASPTLPTGLGINGTTCAISGTPTTLQGATTHTITATNASGNTTFDINITVNIAPPSSLAYTGSPFVFTQNVAITTLSPSSLNGSVTSCSSAPALPDGLGINNITCAITGTPTTLQGATIYTITASNGSGSTNTTISIEISMQPPTNLTYTGSPYSFTRDIAITTITPTVTGTVTSCSASPTLPTGLGINSTTCAISGTPTALQGAIVYTITASNAGGNTTANITISVVLDPPSSLVYPVSALFWLKGSPQIETPTVVGTVTNCVSAPALPAGLSINTTTCVISGTPTGVQGVTNYTITASNAYGSTDASISIRIIAGNTYFAFFTAGTPRGGKYGDANTFTGSTFTNFGTNGNNYVVGFDRTRDILYVGYGGAGETVILAFDNASTNNGSTFRTISNPDMVRPAGIAIDEPNDRLYVATLATIGASSTNRKIFRIENASTLNGGQTTGASFARYNVAAFEPSFQSLRRMILSNNTLYVCDFGVNKVFIFNNVNSFPNGHNLNLDRELEVAGGPAGIAIDEANNLLFVSAFNENKIKVYFNANTVSGLATPDREILSTQISQPGGLVFVPEYNRLYIASYALNSVSYFTNANALNGTYSPAATLNSVTNVTDIAIDLTR